MKVDKITAVQTTQTFTLRIDGKLLLEFLRQTLTIPDHASVTFYVPSGGDWSNMSIEIDKDNPIIVQWQKSEFQTENQ